MSEEVATTQQPIPPTANQEKSSSNQSAPSKEPNSTQILLIILIVMVLLGFLGALVIYLKEQNFMFGSFSFGNPGEEIVDDNLNNDSGKEPLIEESLEPTPKALPSSTPEAFIPAATATPKPSPTQTPTPEKADLRIKKYSFSEDPKMGDEFTVKITIENKGGTSAKNFKWEWWPTAYNSACDGKIDKLAAGESKTVECDYTYGGWSTYETKAVADSSYDVEESDEGNNVASKTVIPTHDEAKADLYISSYSFNHTPEMGEAFTVNITIYNQGDKAAGEFWWEWWPTAYNYACREKITSMAAHGGQVVSCTYTYGGWSTYATKAVADADNNVSESNEDNNSYTQSIVPIH